MIRPVIKEDYKEILSSDSEEDLLEFVSPTIATKSVGKILGDVYLAREKLTEWISANEIDEIIPFFHGEKKQKHKYRVWWLSREKTSDNIKHSYYWGCWFDLRIKHSGSRQHIIAVKLSQAAQNIFKTRRELFETLYDY
jgi:hypothetical protein